MVTTPKILIIDDSNTECLFMRKALQGAGYQVLVANNGYQGIQLLTQENPRCLILDIVLPGMNGFEICRHIRSQSAYQEMPIIMVSTKNSASDRFWAKRQGADYYLSKPFKAEALIEAVKGILGESSNGLTSISQSGEMPWLRPSATLSRPGGAESVPSFRTGEHRPVGTYTTAANETVNVRIETGNPLYSRSMGAQRPVQPRPDSSRTGQQAAASSRSINDGTGPHASVGGSTTNSQFPNAAFGKLVPHRNDNAGLGRSNRVDNLLITDPQIRELYTAIDGQRNIDVLALMTLMGKEEIASAIRILLTQQRISLYDPNGHLSDNPFS